MRGFSLLSSLSAGDLAQVARLSRDRDFPAGAVLAIEDQPVRAAQVVISGRVDLWRAGALVRACQPFDVIELPAIAAGLPHPFTVRAAEPVHTLEIDAGLVAEVLEDDFRLFLEVLRLAARTPPAGRAPAPTVREASDAAGARARARAGGFSHDDAAARLIALRGTDLFKQAPVDGLAALARRLEVAHLAPGDAVVLSDAGEVTVVVEGQVSVPAIEGLPIRASGGDATARVVGSGTVLGLREALAGAPPLAGVRADSSVVLLRGPLADLLDVLDDHHAMARALMAELVTMTVSAA